MKHYLGLALLIGSITAASSCALSSEVSESKAPEEDRILELLQLKPGASVADVGAGDGDYSVLLAREVGVLGRVLATEVEEDHYEDLITRAKDEQLPQLEAVLGDQESIGLPPACCDAILLRKVYHHFEDPSAMGADLWRSLNPSGVLLVIDFKPDKDQGAVVGAPDRGGHGILAEELIEDLEKIGFEVDRREDQWGDEEDEYLVLFRKP